MSFRASAHIVGRAALVALGDGKPASVFAAFDRSVYVETGSGIACLGGADLGKGPLNVSIAGFRVLEPGSRVTIDCHGAAIWRPDVPTTLPEKLPVPKFDLEPARHFLEWLLVATTNPPPTVDALIGMGPGLTPAGDDFVGGAMIALRAFGDGATADRIADWALPLAEKATNRISLAHLRCAAHGEGHEALHRLLCALGDSEAMAGAMSALRRIGHTSGLDAAAGALLALGQTTVRPRPPRRRAPRDDTRSA